MKQTIQRYLNYQKFYKLDLVCLQYGKIDPNLGYDLYLLQLVWKKRKMINEYSENKRK